MTCITWLNMPNTTEGSGLTCGHLSDIPCTWHEDQDSIIPGLAPISFCGAMPDKISFALQDRSRFLSFLQEGVDLIDIDSYLLELIRYIQQTAQVGLQFRYAPLQLLSRSGYNC